MLRDEISLGQRVILESSEVTLANGTAGWHGVVVGALVEVPEFDPNDSEHLHDDGDILKGHRVAFDADDGRVRLVQPGQLCAL